MVKTYRRLFQLGHGLMISWAVFGAIALASQHPWIVMAEGQAQSFLLRLRGPVPPPDEIIILGIDEYSFSQGDLYRAEPDRYPFLAPLSSWPWQRQAYALAIERLMAAGAQVVVIDLLLVDPSVYGPEDDAALEATLDRWGDRVVLAAGYVSGSDLGQFTTLLQPIYGDRAAVGLINLEADSDGQYRATPERSIEALRQTHGFTDGLPSLATATLERAGYPVPPAGQDIFFYGPAGTFPVVSFVQVLDPNNWPLYADQFKDKIVLIGPMAVSLQDQKPTPIERSMPGVEIHANTIAALIENRAMVGPMTLYPLAQGLLTAIALGVIGLGLGYRLTQPMARVVGFAVAIAAWGGLAYLLLVHQGRLAPVAVPVTCLGMGGLIYVVTGAVGNHLEEQRLRRTLERYVAPAVAQEILNQPENFTSLTVGQRLQAAVLFSDIRGFSRISYQLGAEDTVSLLNTYLDVMVDAILHHRGTIDKFIGDAVMAEFGAPTSQGPEQDALNAVAAALAMRRRLASLRITLAAQDLPALYNGIGISYGELVVGNVGSVQRLEYTAIGDTVNVASRIEGLTKLVGTDILITQSCYDLVKDQIIAVSHGAHVLAGREHESVPVYGVVALRGESDRLYRQVQQDLAQHLSQIPQTPKP